jgi:RHS repeat-associated protein
LLIDGSAGGRYKYISVEQDVETGLYHTGPRSYDPWRGGFGQIARFDFLSPDVSPYSYGYDNPIANEDASGDTVLLQLEKEFPGIKLSGRDDLWRGKETSDGAEWESEQKAL